MKDDKRKALNKGCLVIVFFISSMMSIWTGILYAVHMFKNPEQTLTQNIIWFCSSITLWIPWAVMCISYFILYIIYSLETRDKK